jgi:hypothetical protein
VLTIPRIDGRKGDLDEHFGFPADAGLNLKNSAVFGKSVGTLQREKNCSRSTGPRST